MAEEQTDTTNNSVINLVSNISHDTYLKWYSREDVLFELIKQLKGRETMLIGFDLDRKKEYIIRCIKAHSTTFLESNFQAFNFRTRFYNLYRSVALLKDMPTFTYNLGERIKQQDDFNKEFLKYVEGYDFVIDFDGDNVEYDKLWQEVNLVKTMFDDYGVPYILKASSSKGFHIEVRDIFFNGTLNEKLQFSIRFARSIKALFSLSTIDDTIYSLRRVFKIAYCFDIRTGVVALPLSDKQFEMIRYYRDMLKPENIISVRNRGLLERKSVPIRFTSLLDELEEDDLICQIKVEGLNDNVLVA